MGTYVIEAARTTPSVEKTVLVGTVCSYPKFTPVPFREESLWDGYPEETNAPYGLAKKAHLVHAQVNAAQYGQRFAYLIPTNLYGPATSSTPRVSHVIPALIKKCVEAEERGDDKVEVWGTRPGQPRVPLRRRRRRGHRPRRRGRRRPARSRAGQPRHRPRGHDPRDRRDDRPRSSASPASCGGTRPSPTASPAGASTPAAPSTCSGGGPGCRSRRACGRRSTGTSPTAPRPSASPDRRQARHDAGGDRRLRGRRRPGVSIVSWALSPLGLGTIHSTAPPNGSGWRPSDGVADAEGVRGRR